MIYTFLSLTENIIIFVFSAEERIKVINSVLPPLLGYTNCDLHILHRSWVIKQPISWKKRADTITKFRFPQRRGDVPFVKAFLSGVNLLVD